jgi:hypothetical protein
LHKIVQRHEINKVLFYFQEEKEKEGGEKHEEMNGSVREGEREKKKMLCFVDILLTARDADGNGMTQLEIRNEADTFLFEGELIYCCIDTPVSAT